MTKVEMNGKEYVIPEVGFADIIYLEDKGVDFQAGDNMTFRNQITLIAHFLGLETIECANELTQHVKKGGDFITIVEAIGKAIEDAGFTEGQTKTK